MLCGLTIDQMVEGGPAHNSGQLEPGDELLKVDGKDVTEDTFQSIIMGSDTPGSIVTLTVLKISGQVRSSINFPVNCPIALIKNLTCTDIILCV